MKRPATYDDMVTLFGPPGGPTVGRYLKPDRPYSDDWRSVEPAPPGASYGEHATLRDGSDVILWYPADDPDDTKPLAGITQAVPR